MTHLPNVTAPTRLQITEIYLSVQGESTWAGLPCTFIRLTGCPLRCTYCDTEYAFYGGTKVALDDIVSKVREFGCPLVEVTGGEPLAQPNCIALLEALLQDGRTVLLETSGAYPIANVPREVRKIVDLKAPSSGEQHRNLYENTDLLAPHDEVKFVLGSREDYDWAVQQVAIYNLTSRTAAVLFSCVFGKLEPAQLVDWMIADKLFQVRMQLQAHKFIWPADTKGV
jgi:7-carboxy-7-deazaguanine synthase